MAKGKNKKIPRKEKTSKKGERHTFARKEWFNIISPACVQIKKPIGWTCCKKPQGTQVVSDFLKGRIAELTYADVTSSHLDVPKKISSIVDEVQGSNCFTSFYKYELARDKISGMLRKRQTLVEINAEAKTEDGIVVRVFLVVVSNRVEGQVKLNTYIKHAKVKLLRKKMTAEVQKLAAKAKLDNFIYDILTEKLVKDLQAEAVKIVPGCKLQIAKVKTVKRGIVDTKKLVEDLVKVEAAKDTEGAKDKTEENPEAKNKLSSE